MDVRDFDADGCDSDVDVCDFDVDVRWCEMDVSDLRVARRDRDAGVPCDDVRRWCLDLDVCDRAASRSPLVKASPCVRVLRRDFDRPRHRVGALRPLRDVARWPGDVARWLGHVAREPGDVARWPGDVARLPGDVDASAIEVHGWRRVANV